MYCWVKYRHPKTGNSYYFRKYRSDGVHPVGVLPYRFRLRSGDAKLFRTKAEANVVAKHLTSIGYTVSIKSRFCYWYLDLLTLPGGGANV